MFRKDTKNKKQEMMRAEMYEQEFIEFGKSERPSSVTRATATMVWRVIGKPGRGKKLVRYYG